MKYIIDVEKIEGTNLWKAKEFNALVFDKNGLMRMMTLEDELGDYYVELRNEVESKQREIDILAKISEGATEQRLYACEKVEELEHKIASLKGMLKKEGDLLHEAVKEKKQLKEQIEELEKENSKLTYSVGNTVMMENKALRQDNKELKEYNIHLEKEWKDFDKICMKLKTEIGDLKIDLKEYKAVCKLAFEDIEGLKNENKALAEQNSALEDEVVDFEVICTKLHNEKAELLKKYDDKCLEVESLLDTGKLPSNSDFGAIELSKEENVPIEEVVNTDKEINNSDMFEKVFGYYATEVWSKTHSEFIDWMNEKYTPIEEVVDKKYYNKPLSKHDGLLQDDALYDESIFIDEDTVVRLMTNQLEHSEREYGRLLHKIKCQKGMLKKQGKDISRLQKDNKKLKEKLVDVNEKCRYIEQEKSWCNKEYIELKKEHDKLIDRIYFGKDY